MKDPISIAAPLFDDRQFVSEKLALFPYRWRFSFARKYRQLFDTHGRQAANLYLIDQQETIKQHPIGLGASDEEIQAAAKAKARRYFERMAGRSDFDVLYKEISDEIQPLGVTPPALKNNSTYETLCKRFSDPVWWRRALRVAVNRHVEHEAIKAGMVGGRSIYVSNETLQRRKQQDARNSQLLQFIEAENDAGYKATLAELSAAGVSNPENRKHELMTRIRGIEEEARRMGLTCEFYTTTCPSKYHATSDGRANPKYEGYSPRQAQEYLNGVYARIRAKLKRENIQPVGFRVAEPHKDGCPHWHFLLFIEPRKQAAMRAIFKEYALKEHGDEAGANVARFKAKAIDPNKGSAAGYIAKYIAKNVSMAGIEDFDRDGQSATDGLIRSVAWARVWGIRQFQQQGGERVTVWRELRRLRDAQDLPECLKPLWRAADAGEYGQFLRQAVKHKIAFIKAAEKIRPLYKDVYIPDEKGRFDKRAFKKAGQLVDGIYNRYGEPAAGAIKGLLIDGLEVITKFFTWTFTYKRQPLPRTFSNHKPAQHVETGVKHRQKSTRRAQFFRAAFGGGFFYPGRAAPAPLGLV